MPDFLALLAAALPEIPAGRRQIALRRWIAALTGRTINPATTSRYATGKREPSPEMEALLAVIEKPELIEELRK